MKTQKRIWVLEDNPDEAFIYSEILSQRYGYDQFASLKAFVAALGEVQEGKRPGLDLLIADLSLKDGDFLEYLGKEEAARLITMPFVVVSSRDDMETLESCFDEGAMDYLTKPFTKSELLVKIDRFFLKAPNRESAQSPDTIVFDPAMLIVRRGSLVSELTAKEVQIFTILQRGGCALVDRDLILREVWKGTSITSKALDVHMFKLRKKISQLGMEVKFIPPHSYSLLCDGSAAQITLR